MLAPSVAEGAVALDTPAKGAANASDTAIGAIVGEATVASPMHRSHTVARGESLWTIARRYGVAMSELSARNKLDKKAKLRVGTVLQIDGGMPPGGSPPVPAAGP